MPYVLYIEEDAISTAHQLATYDWTSEGVRAKVRGFSEDNFFADAKLGELRSMMIAGHAHVTNYGDYTAEEFADRFNAAFVKRFPNPADKLQIEHLYCVGCELGLELNGKPALAQHIAEALYKKGFLNLQFHAIRNPKNSKPGTTNLIVEVIIRPAAKDVQQGKRGGTLSAFVFDADQNKRYGGLSEQEKGLLVQQEQLEQDYQNNIKKIKDLRQRANATTDNTRQRNAIRRSLEGIKAAKAALLQEPNTQFMHEESPFVAFQKPENTFAHPDVPRNRKPAVKSASENSPPAPKQAAPVLKSKTPYQVVKEYRANLPKGNDKDDLEDLVNQLKKHPENAQDIIRYKLGKHKYSDPTRQLLQGLLNPSPAPVRNRAPDQVPLLAEVANAPAEGEGSMDDNLMKILKEPVHRLIGQLQNEIHALEGSWFSCFGLFTMYERGTKEAKILALTRIYNAGNLQEMYDRTKLAQADSRVMRSMKTHKTRDALERIVIAIENRHREWIRTAEKKRV